MSGIQWEPSTGDLVAGKYELERELGAGGFSRVWRATNKTSGETVALKHPNPTAGKSWRVVQKYFDRELQVLETIQEYGGHQNIMSLHEIVEERDLEFLVVEFIDGELLEDIGSIEDPNQVVKLGIQICEVFSHLHVHEIYYRDLKPDNIMLDDSGSIQLIDFNTARSMPKCADCGHIMQFQNLDTNGCPECGAEMNRETQIQAGENRYKPPEVSTPDNEYPQGPWSDVYSIGKILYFLLCGMVVPLPEEDPRQDAPGTPEYLAEIILKATNLNPVRRYRNASMMKQALEQSDANPDPPKARLRNPDTGETYSIVPGDTIGRSNSSGPYATVVLDDPTPDKLISRVHALFDYQNGHWVISDRSTNGTVIDTGNGWTGIMFPDSWEGKHDEAPPQHAVLPDKSRIAIPRPDQGVVLNFTT